jgi:parallel beta-helix repeat protein
VRGFTDTGILMLGGQDVVVRDNVATNDGGYGIARFVSTGGRVEDNQVSGNGEAGIYWGDSPNSNALVQGNHAYDNGEFGIFIRDSSHGTVQENEADGNCFGIIVLRTGSAPVTDWTVQLNVSHDNTRACPPQEGPSLSGGGIVVAGADHVGVWFNAVTRNAPSGPSFASGGVAVVSTKSFGGADESNVWVYRNTLSKNLPANITWDHKGTNVNLGGNSCSPSC